MLGLVYMLITFSSCQNYCPVKKYQYTLIHVSQPRILMAMARDGLLPPFFSDINKHTQVPVKSTVATGIAAAALAFVMDVSQLAGMVSLLLH